MLIPANPDFKAIEIKETCIWNLGSDWINPQISLMPSIALVDVIISTSPVNKCLIQTTG